MEDKEFETLIKKAIDELPKEFLEKIENVSVIFEDWPSKEQLAKQFKSGTKGILLGLYEGIPQTRRGAYGVGGVLPDKITIFKTPILMVSHSREDVGKNVVDTVKHEIAHHFGMDEGSIRKSQKRG